MLSAIWVAANVVCLGCLYLPLPASHRPYMSRTHSEIRAVKHAKLSRPEVFAKLGSPDAYLPAFHIACYRVNTISQRDLILLLLVIPLGIENRGSPAEFDLALIEFDETDHVKHYQFMRQANGQSYDYVAKAWLASRAKPISKH
jgi:hypothetical protein